MSKKVKTKSVPCKRKLWTEESMTAAVKSCQDGKGLREASRLYNVPLESLRRRVTGAVEMGCRPGPATVLTEEQEERLSQYLIQMSEIGYGLTRDDIMCLAYNMAELTQQHHPFRNGKAGRSWFEGFMSRHPKLTLCKPQPLSQCRALYANKEAIDDFFGKLGGLYGRLNLISKPMQIYNVDETGVSIVHKPGRVVAELGHSNVYSLTSAEKGKTHTILSCVSAAGFVLPPLMIYPRKKSVPEHLRQGAIPNTFFANSQNGWINKEIYIQWLKFFVQSIPPARPVLLLQDGHASHVSIELIEFARENGVHLLCLPAHTTHILQPLDVGVFKSFKAHFSKACRAYLMKNPGQVITTDVIASLVAEAWPSSFTLVNILSGFRKCGVYPINPGAVSDRQLAPSKALGASTIASVPECSIPVFTAEQEATYRRRFTEGYDLPDPNYSAWVKLNHPQAAEVSSQSEVASVSATQSALSSVSVTQSLASVSVAQSEHSSVSVTQSLASVSVESSEVISACGSTQTTSDSLSDLLKLPQPQVLKSKRKAKKSVNHRTACITDDDTLDKLKSQESEKLRAEEEKVAKQLERARKREENKMKKERQKQEREERKKEREKQKEERKKEKEKQKETREIRNVPPKQQQDIPVIELDTDESETECPNCGKIYGAEAATVWICCDGCNAWYDLKCTTIKNKSCIPEYYYCERCL